MTQPKKKPARRKPHAASRMPIVPLRYTIHTPETEPKLVLVFALELLEQAGIRRGDRVNVSLDTAEGIGSAAPHQSIGWILRGVNDSRAYLQLICAYRPECGFPYVRQLTELPVLHAAPGEIIFTLPALSLSKGHP